MKKWLLLLVALPLLTACPPPYEFDTDYTPVYMKRSDLEQSVSFVAPRTLRNLGKIYLKGDTLYLGEKYEGIHVIDNSDPSNPRKLGFIVAPGCVDMAIKNNMLYADNAVDMVCIDLAQHKEVHRERNVFPELVPPDGKEFQHPDKTSDMIVVRWKLSPSK
ncbi:MAG: hypothetical protein LBU92_02180 [Prevotellaceae bacterium]|jgi:hypothetical protein|nr:hypothetical protein [Prevotellaceae bacterium]